ncbi:hypothetical protein [Azospirillum largimobile]
MQPKLIAKHGERPVVRALSALASAYREVPDQLRGPVIEAVVTLVVQYRDRLDEDRLIKALSGTDCTVLCEQASKMRKLVGLSVQDALIASLVKAYDKGLTDPEQLRRWIKDQEVKAACRPTSISEAPYGGAAYRPAGPSIDEVYERLIGKKRSAGSPSSRRNSPRPSTSASRG